MMKRFKNLLSAALLLLGAVKSIAQSGTLQIVVSNVVVHKGLVRVAIYNSEATFMNEKKAFATQLCAVEKHNTLTFTFPKLPFGTYAIAVHQDLNSNYLMDKNLLGIPQEPYAFGNNMAGKWRCPTFRETQIRLTETQKILWVNLLSWSQK